MKNGFGVNPSRTELVTFSYGQKECDYLGKFEYLRCDYYESIHNIDFER